jgi:hypothetical protein
MTAVLSEAIRVIRSITAVPFETTRVIKSITAVLSEKTRVRVVRFFVFKLGFLLLFWFGALKR